jgi:alanine racemase
MGDIASFIELDASAVRHNTAVYRGLLGDTALGCVLKGNAYGHGLPGMAALFRDHVDTTYVIEAEDALVALRAGHRRVLVIGVVSPDEAVTLARAGAELVLAGPGWFPIAAAVGAAGERLRIHLHIDSGLSREGARPEEVHTVFAGVYDGALDVIGVLTHFADTEDVTEHTYARSQLACFERGVAAVTALVGRAVERHAAASAAALVLPESRLDVVRVGIALYGLWPSRETRLSAALVHGALPELRPVLSWRCPSQLVKAVPAGSYVGYGCTHRCTRDSILAVLPVGYFDGYPRLLSGRAHVLVRGQRCPVVGRVMMNHILVDVTDTAAPGERVEATLIGCDGEETLSADQLADWANTINYELVARLPPHLRRYTLAAPRR